MITSVRREVVTLAEFSSLSDDVTALEGEFSSGEFEGELYGFDSHSDVTLRYDRVGSLVQISLVDRIRGDSNNAAFRLSLINLPTALKPSTEYWGYNIAALDNGVECYCSANYNFSSVRLDFYKESYTNWTTYGSKGIEAKNNLIIFPI